MAAPKGHERYGGRVAGTPNKLTRTVRAAFEDAFNALQNDPENKLEAWAKTNPTEFYKLSSKLIPVDMAIQGNVVLNVITGVDSVLPDAGNADISDLA